MLEGQENIRSIAVLRALHLGDLLLAVPALRALRAAYPQAEITLIGLPWAETIVRRYRRYLDRFVAFGGYPGIPELEYDPARSQRFLAEQQRYAYDLVIQMHGNGQISNELAASLGGRMTVGCYEGTRPARLTSGIRYLRDQPEVWRNLALVASLGCTELNPELEFPLQSEDWAEADALLSALGGEDQILIGLHPGARAPSRRWPAEYFAQVGDALAGRAQIILTGSASEREDACQVETQMQAAALNLAGRTSLGGLAALISKLDLFVSNDTGPAHLAEALHCPGVTIFGPAEYQRWAPLQQRQHLAVYHRVECSPCSYWSCPIDHRCMRRLEPAVVLGAAERLLAQRRMIRFPVEKDKEGACDD